MNERSQRDRESSERENQDVQAGCPQSPEGDWIYKWISTDAPYWRRYALAILAFGLALLLDLALVLLGGHWIFVIFYPFLVIVTLYGGLGPGLLALVLSCLAATLLWIEPVGTLTIASIGDTITLGLFILGNFLILYICERFRRAACKVKAQARVLHESECRLALAQEAGKIGVFDWNLLTGKVIWTPEQEKLFGLPKGSFEQDYESWAKRIHPEDKAHLADFFENWIRSGGELQCWVYRIPSQQGQMRWIEACGRVIRDASGQAVRIIGTNRDITDHRRAEEQLLLRSNQLSDAQRVAHMGSWEWDPATDHATWSEELFHIFDLDPKLPPPSCHELKNLTEESRVRLNEMMEKSMETGEPRETMLEIVNPDGTHRWLAARGEPLRDSMGKPTRLIGTAQDVTERKRTEQALRESVETLRIAQEVARIGTFEWNIVTGVVGWSPGMESIYGLPPGGFKGTVEAWLETVYPEDRANANSYLAEALEKSEFKGEWRVVWPDETLHWMAGRGRVFRDESGNPLWMVGVNIDISDSKRLEQEYQQAKDQAVAANAAKDRFLAVLSHELRTPLTPVLLTISARAGDPSLNAELREELARVRRNLELEARLIDDLLDLNRIARGKLALRLQPTDFHNVLKNVVAICQSEIEGKGLRLEVELTASDFIVNGDAGRLQQVFWNLLKNSSKFTPAGGVISLRSFNPRAGVVRAEVTDTGSGIRPEIIPTLFVAFEQGETRHTEHPEGLGLGLAICKAAVEMHGGKIWVESKGAGQGATFSVELPTTPVVPKAAGAAPSGAGAQWNPKIRDRNARILLVEDNADTVRILSRLLERGGCTVSAAYSLHTALSTAREAYQRGEPFDILISDVGLPDGDGRDLMRDLRERYGTSGIAISGYGMEEDIEKSRAAGFMEHLIKPIRFEELKTAVSVLLNKLSSNGTSNGA